MSSSPFMYVANNIWLHFTPLNYLSLCFAPEVCLSWMCEDLSERCSHLSLVALMTSLLLQLDSRRLGALAGDVVMCSMIWQKKAERT